LLGDQGHRPATFLKHEKRVGGLNADVQCCAVGLGAESIDVSQR
jgi:hypothetical protein